MDRDKDHRQSTAVPAPNAAARVPANWATYVVPHSITALTLLFWAWKTILFLVIVNSPGPGYDTSTTLLPANSEDPLSIATSWDGSQFPFAAIVLKFVRWDSIYFVRVAERGYLFEQEWAWGYGYTRVLAHLTSGVLGTGRRSGTIDIALTGVIVSHLSHYLSVLALYALTKALFGHRTQSQKAFCFISAALHIVSPAGAFLSAPYGEALFACLNLTGYYCYVAALLAEESGKCTRRDVNFLTAGCLFALATSVRSNGILSGCLFFYDAVSGCLDILSRGISLSSVRRMIFILLGGSIITLGLIGPQYIAYTTYCADAASSRPWCEQRLPSIYVWVQSHYWNVGFLKYWTLSNLPLFFLATPLLVCLCLSSSAGLQGQLWAANPTQVGPQQTRLRQSCLTRLAIPQALLAIMALTSYHVQIINRISSGYPLWYWFLASLAWEKTQTSDSRIFAVVVRGIVIYGLVQAVLFGSFLPPA